MGVKTRNSVGLKIRTKFRISNKKSFDSTELPSLEKSLFGLQNVSLFTSQQPAYLFGNGTTQKLLEGNSQLYIPLILFVGQTSAVHIPGNGLVTAFVSANPATVDNTERGPCYCTNAGAARTDMSSNPSLNRISDMANVTSKNKEGCCCGSFKDISMEERKKRQDHQTKTTQLAHDGTFKSAGDLYHPNIFENTCSGETGIFKYSPVIQFETILRDGQQDGRIEAKYHCITAMQKYENKSLEELRLEEYLAQNNGNAATNTSPREINAFRQPINTSFGIPVSNFTFGQPSTFNITSNLANTTSSAAGIYTFGQQPVTTFGKPVSNFTFGLPSTSETVDSLLSTTNGTSLRSTTTSTTGTSLFGKPAFTSLNNPESSNSPFGQPLTSNTTNNISSTTTSTTGTSVFGKPTLTSFGKPVSNFSFGKPLTSNTTNNIPSTTTSTTGTSVFGKPAFTSLNNPESNSRFGQPLTSNTTNNISSTTTSTTGTSVFGKPACTSLNNPESNSLFGQPLTSNTTNNISSTTTPTTGTSIVGKPTLTSFSKPVSNFSFGQPLTSNTTNNIPSTTTSTTGTSVFGKPAFTSLNNPESNSPFGHPLTSNTTNNISSTTTPTTGTSIFGKPTLTSFGKPVSNFSFGLPLTSNTTNNIPSTTTSTTGTSVFGKPAFTSLNNPESNSPFGQPLTSNTTYNISSTTTSTTGTSVFGKPACTSLNNPESNSPFGHPLTSNTTNNISSTTTPTTGTSIFGKPTLTSFGKPVSNFSFGQPLTSNTTNNIPSTTTSTTGTSVFGKPACTSLNNPESNSQFEQPLTSNTTNNISSTTTPTTGTSIFGKPTLTSFGKPVSNFSFGLPLTSNTTNNIPSTTTSTTGTSVFGKPAFTSLNNPESNSPFGQPLTSNTTYNISSTTTSTTGTSVFGKPACTSLNNPESNSPFGHPLISNTTNNLPFVTTSAVKMYTPAELSNSSVTSNCIDIFPSTTLPASGICTFGGPNNSSLSKPTSNFTFGRQFTSDVVKKPSNSSASGIITSGMPLISSANNGLFSSAGSQNLTSISGHQTVNEEPETNSIISISNSTESFGKPTTSIKFGLPPASNSTNSLLTSEATQQITGIFGQQIENKCVPPKTTSSSVTCSMFPSNPVSGFRFDQPPFGGPFRFTDIQHTGGFFTQQTSKGSFPPTNLSRPKNVFSKPNANFTQFFPSPFSTVSASNTGFKWKNNNPFNIKTTEKTRPIGLFNQATFSPTRSGFTSFPSPHFCSCNKPPFVLAQSSNSWFENGVSKPGNFAFERDNNASSNTVPVCPFCQTYFDRTQPNHLQKAPFEQQNWPQFPHNRSPVCLFCSKIVQEVRPFQGHLQQRNIPSPFDTTSQNTTQSSFFSQSNTPDINLNEVPSIAVIYAMPGNAFCSIRPVTNNVFGNQEQNTSCDKLGTKLTPYYPFLENDQLICTKSRVNCITRMKEYENKSLEELRFDDYLINYKNRQAATMKLIIGQVQSTLTQLFRDINNKPITSY